MESTVRIIFLLVVMRLSATEEVKKKLPGSVGGNITLPDPVLEFGFLFYGGRNIAMVNEGKLKILEEIYTNRLHWDRNTGLFTLADLQRNDSGIYTIDSKTGKSLSTSYKLTVYDSVAPPTVKNLSSEICSLLCSVDKETTLLWFKDEEILNQSSSALSLPLTVQQQDFSSSYRCVAANPAETKTVTVNVKAICGGNDTNSSDYPAQRNYIILFAVFSIVSALVVIVVALIIKQKYLTENKRTNGQAQGPVGTEEEVEYSDIRVCGNRQEEDLPDSSTTIGHSGLTTVYDKLEVHRMISESVENT
ncbi:uncharacterized protein LOC115794248 [Archocentrus centrarchus]|uniref:uncharacterized protein LOC115794248 n=1 Tax=Archocentrus centrarchus TaxID=63155 RepID=UPI0011E9EC51|nr:uncharacterized protein LOC115794248 [Archocentrus centrarchus]